MKKAVALGYDKSKVAPEVVAKGFGNQAQILIKRAQELDIAIKEDRILSEALSTLPYGMPIPEDFYQIVASLYAFIQKLEAGKHK